MSQWPGYMLAVVGIAVGALVRLALLQVAGSSLPPYLTFYPVVFAAAVIGGTGPGVLATILGTLAADWFFIEPMGTLALPNSGEMTSMIFFIAVNLGISVLGGRFRAKSDALRKEATRTRLAHQVTQVGSFEWNVETGEKTWSPELEAMHGLRPGQFGRTKSDWEALVHPEDLPGVLVSAERSLRTFEPQENEWRVVWPDGTVHWLLGRFQAFPNRAGRPLRVLGVNIDITDRKKGQEAARQREELLRKMAAERETEERFHTMVDAISQLAWICRADGYFMWYNRRVYEYTGATLEQLEGWGWGTALDPQALPKVLELWQHSLATGEPFVEMELSIRGADGRFRPFLAHTIPVKDDDGRVKLWFGTGTNISELREREKALARQARLIDLSPTATLILKPDHTIAFWSDGAERLYGWSRKEALGRRSHELLRTTFPEPQESIVAKVQDEGVWSGELRQYTRDDRLVVVQSYWLAERNAKGELAELLESNTDITERKRLQEHLEEEVEARTSKLREALTDLEHMSYSMVHDMRAPLRAMQGFTVLLEEECPDYWKSQASEYLHYIRESSSRLDRLITDALNYNRVISKDLPLASVEIRKLLEGMIQTYPHLHPRFADITIEFEKLSVLGNESLLTQCLGNLLENAVKFIAPGVRPSVHISAEEIIHGREPAMERIWIADNGVGIPKASQEKIFRMFQRMHSEAEYPGTGIGLAIVKKAVERMNGRVGLESEPGKGSKFWIELPTAPKAKSHPHMQEAA